MSEHEDAASDADGSESDTDAAAGAEDETDEGSETEAAPEDLVERVAGSDPEEVAREVHGLREQVADLRERLDDREERVDDLESSLKRTKADFQNYKKRQERKREQLRQRATEDLVERLLDVRDNLERALEAEGDVRDGVESTLRQFDRVLNEESVEPIAPDPGDEVDPQRHEVLMRVAADYPEGAVADVHRPGYEMAEKVLRPAQVTVSEGRDGGGGERGSRDGDGRSGESGDDAEPESGA
jgi:molecular chaperone GrpE